MSFPTKTALVLAVVVAALGFLFLIVHFRRTGGYKQIVLSHSAEP